jgi:hypothetical protein
MPFSISRSLTKHKIVARPTCRYFASLGADRPNALFFAGNLGQLANRPLIRQQAFGEALDPDKLERLGRYEVHLDRKLERMLTMLLRLKELRLTSVEG